MMRACSKCGVVKTLGEFNRQSRNLDGLRKECRACQSAYNAGRYDWSTNCRLRAPEKHAARTALRAARKKRATPAWANLELVGAYYTMAAWLTQETGVPHHVDRIEPLRGKHVCGLHNEFNLQVLPARVNIAKSNRPSDVVGLR